MRTSWSFMGVGSSFVLAVVLATASASAGTVYLDTIPSYPNPVGGGPFMVHVVNAINEGGADYAAGATFKTFCIEYTEEFYAGSSHQYDTNISDKAVFGHNSDGTTNYDPLSSATAWLFSTWAHGNLGTYVPGWTDSAANVYALQDALWKLQQWVLADTSGATAGLKTTLVNLATTNANGSLYDVRVMQLWDIGHSHDTTPNPAYAHQDQLILVPFPSVGTAGMGLLAGIGAVGWIRRRQNAIGV